MVCAICLDSLKDPVAPPCGHVMCTPCLRKHIDRSSQPDSEMTGKRWTFCPTCKAKFRSDDSVGPESTIRRIYIDSDEPAECKLLLLGDSSVGKTSLLQRFTEERWVPDGVAATVGVDFKFVRMKVRGRNVKLNIWDTAGQERHRSIPSSYYRRAQGIILVYDISNKDSFDAIPRWYSELKQHIAPSVVKIIVGNKLDKESERQVPTADGQAFATCVDSLFIETSVMTAVGVVEAFGRVVAEILDTPELWDSAGQFMSASGSSSGREGNSVKLEDVKKPGAKRVADAPRGCAC